MVNLLHLCELMTQRYHDVADLRIPLDTFIKFAERNNFRVVKRLSRDRVRIKLFRKQVPVCVISDDSCPEFKFMDMADIHIGNPSFDEGLFRSKLQYAVDNDVKLVFIAGDIFEGVASEQEESHYCEQLQKAYDIFKDYPLTYHVINGNHDYSFEQIGLPNPLKTLESRLKSIGIDFNFYDVYLMDFVVSGVIKRVMHVERQVYSLKRIFSILKLKQFDADGFLTNQVGPNVSQELCGKNLPVRFFTVGHIHMNVQIYYARKRIYISHPGSFLRDYSDGDDCCNVISGRIIDQKVFLD